MWEYFTVCNVMQERSLMVRVSSVWEYSRALLTTPYCLSHRQTPNFFYIISLYSDYNRVYDSLSSYPLTSLEIREGNCLHFVLRLQWLHLNHFYTYPDVDPPTHVTANLIYALLSNNEIKHTYWKKIEDKWRILKTNEEYWR